MNKFCLHLNVVILCNLYIILALLLWLNVCVSWHYSRGSRLDPLWCRNSGRNIGTMHHEYDSSSICIHEHMIKDEIMISYYLSQPLNRFKGNKSVWASGKANPTITFRNELDPEKQDITQRWERSFTSRRLSTDEK